MLSYCAMSELFDFNDEIQFIDEAPDRYGVEGEHFFYLCRMCGTIGVIVPVFEIERAEKSCVVTAYGKHCSHSIEIREARILLGSQLIEDKAPGSGESFFVGYANQPKSWEGVIRHVFKTERAILQLIDFSGRLKAEWNEFLRIRQDRLGF